LLTDQSGLSHLRVTLPFSNKQLSQERIKRLLFTAELLATTAVLLVKCAEEPLENQKGTLRGISLLGWRNEDSRVFGPIGRVFGKGSSRKNEWWSSQGR
jgi:hypothetical protein